MKNTLNDWHAGTAEIVRRGREIAEREEAPAARFLNHYTCERCGEAWQDEWSCAADDDCPSCGARHMTPHTSEELAR